MARQREEPLEAERECPTCGCIWFAVVTHIDRVNTMHRRVCPECKGREAQSATVNKAYERLMNEMVRQPTAMLMGTCRETDPEIFFPRVGGSTRQAKAICRECPAQTACLEWALKTRQMHGVWGGTNERERAQLLALRAKAEVAS